MITRIMFTISLCFLALLSYAQKPCGVSSNLNYTSTVNVSEVIEKHQDYKSNKMRIIPIQAHLILKSDGLGGVGSAKKIETGIEQANRQFEHLNMHFLLCNEVNQIVDALYPSVNFDVSHELHQKYGVDGAVNMYVAQTLDTGDGFACGWATLPWWRDQGYDYIFMDENCMIDNTTLAHEVGHYLGLLHTHNVAFVDTLVVDPMTGDTINFGVEFVDQSNCDIGGDMLCDTSADPLLGNLNVSLSNCTYSGRERDPWGVAYSDNPPDPAYRMSYAPRNCMSTFSPMQISLMNFWLSERTPELTCSGPGDIILHDFAIAQEEFQPGDQFDIEMDLSYFNFDKGEDKPLDLKFYLSKNSTLDDNDILIHEVYDLDIVENTYFSNTQTISIPDNYDRLGINFLLFYVDPDNKYEELKEGNNFSRFTFFLDPKETTTSTIDALSGNPITVYPNPSIGDVFIKGLDNRYGTVIVELYNSVGMHVESRHIQSYGDQIQFSYPSLIPGLYTLQIFTLEGKQITSLPLINK